jgi:hypothetical protein
MKYCDAGIARGGEGNMRPEAMAEHAPRKPTYLLFLDL